MNEDLEKSKSIREIYEGIPDEILEKIGYKLEGLSDEEKEQQLKETIAFHQHLRDLEEKGKTEEFETEEIQKGLEIPEKVKSPEEKEYYEKCLKSAENILKMFDLNPKKEDLLVITDAKVIKVNPQMVEVVIEKAQEIMGNNFRVMVAPESKKSAEPLLEEIGERMVGRPVLIITSRSRSHSPETSAALFQEEVLSKKAVEEWDKIIKSEEFKKIVISGWSGITSDRLQQLREEGIERALDLEKYKQFCKKRNARVVSITKGHNPGGILTEGPALENIETIREKGENVDQLMKNVEKVYITSEKGTDLWLYPIVRAQEFEDGKVDKPGKVSNFPIGEWGCAVRLEGTTGTLVVDGPYGGGLDQHLIGAGIKLKIENGLVKKIEGVKHKEGRKILEELAEKNERAADLLKILDSGDLDKIFEAITKEDLPEIWQSLSENEQDSIKSCLAAERFKNYLEIGNRDYRKKYPEDKKADAFKIAELGIGTNTKAENAQKSSDREKKYGTIHIAKGRNATFGLSEEDPNYNNVEIHCDGVLNKPTVECYRKDGTKFILIENGRAKGY